MNGMNHPNWDKAEQEWNEPPDDDEDLRPCQSCDGQGEILTKVDIGHGDYREDIDECDECNGTGAVKV